MCHTCGYHDCTCKQPPRDWKPGDSILIEARVIPAMPEKDGHLRIEIPNHYYSDEEQITAFVSINSIRPMPRKDGGK